MLYRTVVPVRVTYSLFMFVVSDTWFVKMKHHFQHDQCKDVG
jgi:hypothetical protein